MSEPFIAEIRIFAGNFAPRNWAFCDGQILPIAQNTALFSLIGTTYGGDGRTTTGLPNLQGKVPMHPGSGPGLTTRRLGESGGVETVTLTEAQMAQHSHPLAASQPLADDDDPGPTKYLATGRGLGLYKAPESLVSMAPEAITSVGEGQPHNNLQPFLVLQFIIALVGLYPSRS
ncbi:MAG: phage tail protein [Candidatus Omnitrophica bacterium]|nr:phage tail protein [Candidatus Omnitrophota bacterium]